LSAIELLINLGEYMTNLLQSSSEALDQFLDVSDEALDVSVNTEATALTTCSKSAPGGYCN
jgi:hypothetical protein